MLGQAYLGFPESVVLSGSVGSVENPGTTGGYNRGRTLTHELGHNFTFNHDFVLAEIDQPIAGWDWLTQARLDITWQGKQCFLTKGKVIKAKLVMASTDGDRDSAQ